MYRVIPLNDVLRLEIYKNPNVIFDDELWTVDDWNTAFSDGSLSSAAYDSLKYIRKVS